MSIMQEYTTYKSAATSVLNRDYNGYARNIETNFLDMCRKTLTGNMLKIIENAKVIDYVLNPNADKWAQTTLHRIELDNKKYNAWEFDTFLTNLFRNTSINELSTSVVIDGSLFKKVLKRVSGNYTFFTNDNMLYVQHRDNASEYFGRSNTHIPPTTIDGTIARFSLILSSNEHITLTIHALGVKLVSDEGYTANFNSVI